MSGFSAMNYTRGYGGIGRRARFRIWYLRCAGSSPVTRTNKRKEGSSLFSFIGAADSLNLNPSPRSQTLESCSSPVPPLFCCCDRQSQLKPVSKVEDLGIMFKSCSSPLLLLRPAVPTSTRLQGRRPWNYVQVLFSSLTGILIDKTNLIC